MTRAAPRGSASVVLVRPLVARARALSGRARGVLRRHRPHARDARRHGREGVPCAAVRRLGRGHPVERGPDASLADCRGDPCRRLRDRRVRLPLGADPARRPLAVVSLPPHPRRRRRGRPRRRPSARAGLAPGDHGERGPCAGGPRALLRPGREARPRDARRDLRITEVASPTTRPRLWRRVIARSSTRRSASARHAPSSCSPTRSSTGRSSRQTRTSWRSSVRPRRRAWRAAAPGITDQVRRAIRSALSQDEAQLEVVAEGSASRPAASSVG